MCFTQPLQQVYACIHFTDVAELACCLNPEFEVAYVLSPYLFMSGSELSNTFFD